MNVKLAIHLQIWIIIINGLPIHFMLKGFNRIIETFNKTNDIIIETTLIIKLVSLGLPGLH